MISALPPLKRFGQNFLIDKNIIRKIVQSISISKDNNVLEIGPGRGALTGELARFARHVLAVEIDKGLCKELEPFIANSSNIEIKCQDILKLNLAHYAKSKKIKSFKVVANLPYYITTPIIEYLFKNRAFISDVFIMVQKEVADRMIAKPNVKTYSAFSCFVNYFSQVKVLFQIKRTCFYPEPKVDSSFVHLSFFPDPSSLYGVKSETFLFRVMRCAFGQRRKQIGGILAKELGKKAISGVTNSQFLSRRAENMSLHDFVVLSNLLID